MFKNERNESESEIERACEWEREKEKCQDEMRRNARKQALRKSYQWWKWQNTFDVTFATISIMCLCWRWCWCCVQSRYRYRCHALSTLSPPILVANTFLNRNWWRGVWFFHLGKSVFIWRLLPRFQLLNSNSIIPCQQQCMLVWKRADGIGGFTPFASIRTHSR